MVLMVVAFLNDITSVTDTELSFMKMLLISFTHIKLHKITT